MMTESERLEALVSIDAEVEALRTEWSQLDHAIAAGSTDVRLHQRRNTLEDRIGELVQQRERISHAEV